MEVNLKALLGNKLILCEIDLADMATTIQWTRKDVYNRDIYGQLDDYAKVLTESETNTPPIPLQGEYLMAFHEGDLRFGAFDYYFIEGMRAPKKRNENLRYCVIVEADSEYYYLRETIQDVTNFDPHKYFKETTHKIKGGWGSYEPYHKFQRKNIPIFHVRGLDNMFNVTPYPEGEFINERSWL